MANNVIFQVVGGKKIVMDNVETVADVKAQAKLEGSFVYKVNNVPADDFVQVREKDVVTAGQGVKGGAK
jgi:hypothetical protein